MYPIQGTTPALEFAQQQGKQPPVPFDNFVPYEPKIITSSPSVSTTMTGKAHIPPPPNSFMLYCTAKRSTIPHYLVPKLATVLADMWHAEDPEVVLQFEKLADQEKIKHIREHGVYKTTKKATKKVKAPAKKKAKASAKIVTSKAKAVNAKKVATKRPVNTNYAGGQATPVANIYGARLPLERLVPCIASEYGTSAASSPDTIGPATPGDGPTYNAYGGEPPFEQPHADGSFHYDFSNSTSGDGPTDRAYGGELPYKQPPRDGRSYNDFLNKDLNINDAAMNMHPNDIHITADIPQQEHQDFGTGEFYDGRDFDANKYQSFDVDQPIVGDVEIGFHENAIAGSSKPYTQHAAPGPSIAMPSTYCRHYDTPFIFTPMTRPPPSPHRLYYDEPTHYNQYEALSPVFDMGFSFEEWFSVLLGNH
ncbi:hypothetical protein DXG01_009799 [Tephrocybe rancida]|nr:hypothetical protein DXG01_009799 [Tephrocybe rancida]